MFDNLKGGGGAQIRQFKNLPTWMALCNYIVNSIFTEDTERKSHPKKQNRYIGIYQKGHCNIIITRGKIKGGMESPPTLKICNFAGQKWWCNVFLQGNLLESGPLVNCCY